MKGWGVRREREREDRRICSVEDEMGSMGCRDGDAEIRSDRTD